MSNSIKAVQSLSINAAIVVNVTQGGLLSMSGDRLAPHRTARIVSFLKTDETTNRLAGTYL